MTPEQKKQIEELIEAGEKFTKGIISIEETETTLWLGVSRKKSHKVDDIVCSFDIEGYTDEYTSRQYSNSEFIKQSVNSREAIKALYEAAEVMAEALIIARDYMHDRHMHLLWNKRTCGKYEERQLDEKMIKINKAIKTYAQYNALKEKDNE